MFYIAQVFGVLGLIMIVISFQNNDKQKLLKYQIFSSLLFAIQYLCLNATNGCLMNVMTLIRNIIYKRYKKTPLLYVIVIISFMIGLSLLFYDGLFSLFPGVAVILYTLALWQNNLTITRIGEAVACLVLAIYNIKVLAISGLVSTLLELCFAIIAIYRFDIRERKRIKYAEEV